VKYIQVLKLPLNRFGTVRMKTLWSKLRIINPVRWSRFADSLAMKECIQAGGRKVTQTCNSVPCSQLEVVVDEWPEWRSLCISFSSRHAKSCSHAVNGRGNIFRLRKEKRWNAVEFVKSIGLTSLNYQFLKL
jgi:hypothetical protein